MNSINDTDPTQQAGRAFAERLGSLAAEQPAIRPGVNTQFAAPPAPLPAWWPSVLAQLRQRAHRREHAARKLRAEEFIVAP
jgi:hypothetical protein